MNSIAEGAVASQSSSVLCVAGHRVASHCTFVRRVRAVIVLLLLAAMPAYGIGPAQDDSPIGVLPSDEVVVIPIDELLVNDGGTLADLQTFSFTAPQYGTLTRVDDHLVYEANGEGVAHASFWTHNSDSFTYTIRGTHPKSVPSTATVFLVANRFGDGQVAWDFEASDVPFFDPNFSPDVTTEAALVGVKGLALGLPIEGPGEPVAAFSEADFNQDGDGADSGSSCYKGDHDPLEGLSFNSRLTLLGVGGSDSDLRFSYALQGDNGTFEVRGEALDDYGQLQVSPWVPLTPGPHDFELDWWAEESGQSPGGGQGTGGFMVRVDGVVVGRRSGLMMTGYFDVSSVMAVEGDFDFGGTLLLDDIVLASAKNRVSYSLVEVFRLDGFEHGLAGWYNTTTTNAEADSASAITGQFGLRVEIGESEPFLTDTMPQGSTFGTRFRVDLGDVVLPEDARLTIFEASSEEPESATGKHLWLKLKQVNGALKIRAQQATDAFGIYASSPWYTVPTGAFAVDVDWRAASDAAHANGRLRLWIDGQLAGELTGLDTDEQSIETVRLGAVVVTGSGVSGPLHLDNFESWGPGTLPPILP